MNSVRYNLIVLVTTMLSLSVNANDVNVDQVIRNPSLGVENTVYVGDTIYDRPLER